MEPIKPTRAESDTRPPELSKSQPHLKDERAEGMGRRIKTHVEEQADKGLGPRIVCSLNSIRALPKVQPRCAARCHGASAQ